MQNARARPPKCMSRRTAVGISVFDYQLELLVASVGI
eukprot:COSAG02_NODE_65179_length_258_cov_1.301887_1_plen_36_part_01